MNTSEIEKRKLRVAHRDLKIDVKFFNDLWALIKPYWLSEERQSAWLLLILNFICVLGVVAAGVGYNYFYKFFYDALQALDTQGILYSFYFYVADRSFLTLSAVGVSLREFHDEVINFKQFIQLIVEIDERKMTPQFH